MPTCSFLRLVADNEGVTRVDSSFTRQSSGIASDGTGVRLRRAARMVGRPRRSRRSLLPGRSSWEALRLDDAIARAAGLARLLGLALAFVALGRVNLVVGVARADRLVGALGLARSAADAIVSDLVSH